MPQASTHFRAFHNDVDVAIIGAGFCGSILALRLLHRSDVRSVALIDGTGRFGAGAAYATAHPEHLLNVPAGKMSAFPETPDHFLTWLRTNRRALEGLVSDDVQPSDFVPRLAFGMYIRALLESAPLDGEGIASVVQTATDVSIDEHGATVWFEHGSHVRAAACVLATGNEAPLDVPGISAELKHSSIYCSDPWRRNLAKQAGKAASVLLIGSGLTAIDVALTLKSANPEAAIHMLSRHGRLPRPHMQMTPPAVDLSDLLGTRSILEVSRRLRAEVSGLADDGADWRCVIDAVRPHTHGIWRGMDPVSRRRFLRHARALWEIHRHRIAPAVDQTVREMLSSGALSVRAGRIVHSIARSGRAVVSYQRSDGGLASIEADLVVNCTGPATDLRRSPAALWRNLIARGNIRPDALGLGLETDDRGAVVDARGSASRRLFALGGLRRPDLFESTAVPELRQQVKDLAMLLQPASAALTALPA
jgi:uncharacterized NAD(P)/FAD-binding protein YdhS